MNLYQCRWCRKILERDSDKKRIKSHCDAVGRYVYLIMVEKTAANYHVMEASKP